MKITMLGTGTSHGVPVVGCSCGTCMSDNPKNKRYRTSVLIENNGKNIIIDIPAEFRLRTLEYNVRHVDALVLTHSHADHTAGLDDIRRYNELQKGESIPLYADEETLKDIRRRFDYIFSETQIGGGKPKLDLIPVQHTKDINAAGLDTKPLAVKHGRMDIMAYRAGGFAFITDVSEIPESTLDELKGLEVLILDALRIEKHPTHFNLEQAVEVAGKIGAKKTYFTHIAHSLEYEETNKGLPEGMELSYDGLVIKL